MVRENRITDGDVSSNALRVTALAPILEGASEVFLQQSKGGEETTKSEGKKRVSSPSGQKGKRDAP
jgi:hypothetical protein